MATMARKSLEEYLGLEYPFEVHAEPEGGYVIVFPDLPGCMTQVERLEEVGPAAEEIRALWIETEYEAGADIPLPSYPEEYSGKFNLRLSRALHRTLAEAAARNSVSLNTYVSGLLERGHTQACVERRVEECEARLLERLTGIEAQLDLMQESLRYRPTGVPRPSRSRESFQIVQDQEAVAA